MVIDPRPNKLSFKDRGVLEREGPFVPGTPTENLPSTTERRDYMYSKGSEAGVDGRRKDADIRFRGNFSRFAAGLHRHLLNRKWNCTPQ